MDDLFRRLLAFTRDGVYRYRFADGTVLLANEGLVRILDLDLRPEELTGRRLRDLLVYTEKEGSVRQELEKHGEIHGFRYHFKTLKGQDRWVIHDSFVTKDEATGETVVEAIVKDITEAKLAEERLAAEREWFAVTLRCIGDGVIATDAQGRVVLMNPVAEDLTGWREEEALGKPIEDVFRIIHEVTRAPAEHPVRKVLATGRVVRLANHTALIARDGTERAIADSGAPILSPAKAVVGVVKVFRDVTEQRHMQDALRDSEARFRGLFQTMMSGVFEAELLCNAQGRPCDYRFVEVNPAYEKIAGRGRAELVGRTVCETWRDGVAKWVEIFGRVVQTGQAAHFEESFAPLQRRYEVRAYLTRPGHFAAVMNDVTDQRKMEAELAKTDRLNSLGLLAGGIAHDFNNILTAILGNVSLARLPAAARSSELPNLLEDVEKACFRARDLTRQLLTFADGGAPVRKATDLRDALQETASFVTRGSKCRCEFQLAADLWPANVDAAQISQVVHNLVLNAVQAMPTGGIITVAADNAPLAAEDPSGLPRGRYVRIAVADTGTGIHPDHLDRIFDPYFTTKQQGSGLGLSTAYSIITRHGGHVWVESQLGAGSRFFFLVPASDQPAAQRDTKLLTTPAVGDARILILDDEDVIRTLLERLLTGAGYTVTSVADGALAIEKHRAARQAGQPFDLAILDLTVPGGMGGIQALEALKKEDPGVRAIASSGYSTDPVMAEPAKYGFCGALSKPYVVQEMLNLIRRALTAKG